MHPDLEKTTGTTPAMCHCRGPSCAEPGERVRAWCAVTEAGEGAASSTGSPSLLLGNFSSCFLGTSYLEKRGRETLKASRWGPFCPGPLLCRHGVCAALSKNPSKCSPERLWGGLLGCSPASVISTILGVIGGHIPSFNIALSH